MKLLFAPPHLAERLRAAFASLIEAAPGRCAELHVISRLEEWPPAGVTAAAVVTAPAESVRAWAQSREPVKGAGMVAASNYLAGAAAVASCPGALMVSEAELLGDTEGVLRRLATFLVGAPPESWTPPTENAGMPGKDRVRAELAALELYGALPLKPGASAWWPGELFHSSEPGFPGPIDITGPARNLAFGPYVYLHPGIWEAELVFELSPDAAQYDYTMDFGVLYDFAQCVVRPAGAARQVASLRHAINSPQPAEVRLWLARAAFHGEVTLHGAKVTYVAPTPEGE